MKSIAPVFAALFLFLANAEISPAVPFKTHVAEFSVAGAPNREELKQTLQGILTSRLDSNLVQLVENPDKAEYLVIGSYAMFGKIFSLDVLIKNREHGSLIKAFEQGEGQEDIIPAMGRLARKINAELVKIPQQAAPVVPVTAPPVSSDALPAVSLKPLNNAPQKTIKENYIIQTEASTKDNWSSDPLEGVFTSISLGRKLPSGEQELFVAGERIIRAYQKGKDLKLMAEITIPAPSKILSIDTADLDRDGTTEVYVTIMDRETLVSRAYRFDGTAFTIIAQNLPWFFRGIGYDVFSRTIYVQEMETTGRYFGDVKELVKSDGRFTTKNPKKLPSSGNIYNFNRLSDNSGKIFYVVLDEDNHLVISSSDGKEVWKSSENFGGSESFFKNEVIEQMRSTGDQYRWTFLEQRITLLKDGTLIVPQNAGTFNVGNNRAFNKHTLFAFNWTGAVLKEKWHTRQSPGYLSDYAYDNVSGELLLLEVVQKASIFSKGKSVISINRID